MRPSSSVGSFTIYASAAGYRNHHHHHHHHRRRRGRLIPGPFVSMMRPATLRPPVRSKLDRQLAAAGPDGWRERESKGERKCGWPLSAVTWAPWHKTTPRRRRPPPPISADTLDRYTRRGPTTLDILAVQLFVFVFFLLRGPQRERRTLEPFRADVVNGNR